MNICISCFLLKPSKIRLYKTVIKCLYTFKGSGAVIHTHSSKAVMVTLLYTGNEFKITHQEMIKGIRKGSSSESYRFTIVCYFYCLLLYSIVYYCISMFLLYLFILFYITKGVF